MSLLHIDFVNAFLPQRNYNIIMLHTLSKIKHSQPWLFNLNLLEKRYRFSRSTKKRVVFLFTVLISDNPAHWYRLINIQRIYHYGTLRLTANCCLSNMNVYIKMPWYLKRHDFLCIYVAKEMQNQINMPIKFFWPLLCP